MNGCNCKMCHTERTLCTKRAGQRQNWNKRGDNFVAQMLAVWKAVANDASKIKLYPFWEMKYSSARSPSPGMFGPSFVASKSWTEHVQCLHTHLAKRTHLFFSFHSVRSTLSSALRCNFLRSFFFLVLFRFCRFRSHETYEFYDKRTLCIGLVGRVQHYHLLYHMHAVQTKNNTIDRWRFEQTNELNELYNNKINRRTFARPRYHHSHLLGVKCEKMTCTLQ